MSFVYVTISTYSYEYSHPIQTMKKTWFEPSVISQFYLSFSLCHPPRNQRAFLSFSSSTHLYHRSPFPKPSKPALQTPVQHLPHKKYTKEVFCITISFLFLSFFLCTLIDGFLFFCLFFFSVCVCFCVALRALCVRARAVRNGRRYQGDRRRAEQPFHWGWSDSQGGAVPHRPRQDRRLCIF